MAIVVLGHWVEELASEGVFFEKPHLSGEEVEERSRVLLIPG